MMKRLCVLDKGIYYFPSEADCSETIYQNYFDRQDENSSFSYKLSLFRKFTRNRPATLLDIGCGPGYLVKAAGKKGFHAEGIDISDRAVAFARKNGAAVKKIKFTDFDDNKKFDIVHMKTFLEHTATPLECLKKATGMVEKGGILYIEGPNDFNPLQKLAYRILNTGSWWVTYPHHLSYIKRNALKKLLKTEGFSIIHEEMTMPVELFLFLGLNYVKYPHRGRVIGKLMFILNRMSRKYSFISKTAGFFRGLMPVTGCGRRYVIYARKESV